MTRTLVRTALARVLAGLVLTLGLLSANCARAFAALPAGQIQTYDIPAADGSAPDSITAGPDGHLWFTEIDNAQIGQVTTAGAFQAFTTPKTGSYAITGGSSGDGHLWFTDAGDDEIGKVTPTPESITEYPIPPIMNEAPEPHAITAGPDSALWFIENGVNMIDRIPTNATTTTPGIQQFTIPTANADATGITTGPDGNLWFTEESGDKIGKLTPAGDFTEYPNAGGSFPSAITAGPDGALWFTEFGAIGEITTSGAITAFPLPSPTGGMGGADPTDTIAPGPDGNLWFAATTGSTPGSEWIGRMTPAGAVTYYPLSGPAITGPNVAGIAAGPDGNMWFTEADANDIGEIGTASGEPSVSLSPLSGVNFGNSTLNATSGPQKVTLTNTGGAPLMLGAVQIVGPVGTPFGTTADGCSDQTVGAGDTCTIEVTFAPTSAGSYAASLQFSDNADNSPQSLALTGSSEPVFASAGLSFGSVAVGNSEGPSNLIVDNEGAAPLMVSSVQLTGPQASSFRVTTDGCSGQAVPPVESCTVGIAFSPLVAGPNSASLSVTDNASGSPQAVPLSGAGVPPSAGVTPSSLDFGSLTAGTSSAPQTVTVTNPGPIGITVSSLQFVGTGAGAFTTTSDTCTGQTVASGGSCAVGVSFAPSSAGSYSASLQIDDTAANNPQSVALSGSSSPAVPSLGLSGTVTDGAAGDVPIVALVSVCPLDPALSSQCQSLATAADGRYDFPSLSSGVWHVEVSPGEPGLYSASADVTLSPGVGAVQDFTLEPPAPLSGGVTFSGPSGTTTSGVPGEYDNDPFSFSVPVRINGNQTPNSTNVYAFVANIASLGGGGVNLAGVLLFSVHFNASGQPDKMSNIIEGQLDCGPLGSPSPCAELSALGSPVQAPSMRLTGNRLAPRQDCGTGVGAFKGQFNLYPTKNGGIIFEFYYGFGDYGQIPLDPIGLATPEDTGNPLQDAALDLAVASGNALFSKFPAFAAYNTVIGVLNNVANVAHTVNGGITLGNVLTGTASIAIAALGVNSGGAFTWGAGLINNTFGNLLGTVNPSPPPTPAPCPPKPPQPGGPGPGGGGGAGGGAGGDFYLDPSGRVQTTRGVPLAEATVTLTRATTAHGRQVPVPAGSTIMSPGNRRNPDRSGPLGTFGWDVLPGYYRITAKREGCRAPRGGRVARSAVHQVPPAVENIVLTLRCANIRRRPVRIRLSLAREKYGTFVLRVRLTSSGARLPFLGTITLKLGSRTLASLVPSPGTGTAILDADGLRRGRNTISATYTGDAALAPAHGQLTQMGR